jgi:hypothetical protein
MKTVIAALLTFGLATQAAPAEEIPSKTMNALIDDLTAVDGDTLGISDDAMYEGFIATDAPQLVSGTLPSRDIKVYPAMREIVRRGASALPALLAHLDDRRPTKMRVGEDVPQIQTFGGQFFSDEYDARGLRSKRDDCTDDGKCRSFDHPYTIKVGDVCEVLIGQIVNRGLAAARYQPSSLVYVNSPIETPSLAERLRKDWGGLDAKAHEASLLSDLRSRDELDRYRDALIRLRFYCPKTYAALSGKDLEKRNAFEADEKKRR